MRSSVTRDLGLLVVAAALGFVGAAQLLPLAHASQPPCYGVDDEHESFQPSTLTTDEDLPSWGWLTLGMDAWIMLEPTDPDEPMLIIEWSRLEAGE